MRFLRSLLITTRNGSANKGNFGIAYRSLKRISILHKAINCIALYFPGNPGTGFGLMKTVSYYLL